MTKYYWLFENIVVMKKVVFVVLLFVILLFRLDYQTC